jgi:protein-disulfide isomerase
MLRPFAPLAIALSLGLLAACDKAEDADVGALVDERVGSLETKIDAATKGNADLVKQNEELRGQIKSLGTQVAQMETGLADALARLDAIEQQPDPTPTPTPTFGAGRPDPAETYKVDLGDAQTRGPDTALVTVVAWSDFQCPYCNRVVPTLEQLEADYGSDLRLAFKHNPLAFHKDAMPAAKAAEAAGEQGKFWEMHDKLFDNNRDLTEANFVKWAKELGLDTTRFKADMASSSIERRIKDHQSQGNTLGARGTPAFFINGRFLSGAQPLESFKKVVDEEMTKARAKVSAGTSRDRVYAETIAGGKTAP